VEQTSIAATICFGLHLLARVHFAHSRAAFDLTPQDLAPAIYIDPHLPEASPFPFGIVAGKGWPNSVLERLLTFFDVKKRSREGQRLRIGCGQFESGSFDDWCDDSNRSMMRIGRAG
jgi:hypothetical protein